MGILQATHGEQVCSHQQVIGRSVIFKRKTQEKTPEGSTQQNHSACLTRSRLRIDQKGETTNQIPVLRQWVVLLLLCCVRSFHSIRICIENVLIRIVYAFDSVEYHLSLSERALRSRLNTFFFLSFFPNGEWAEKTKNYTFALEYVCEVKWGEEEVDERRAEKSHKEFLAKTKTIVIREKRSICLLLYSSIVRGRSVSVTRDHNDDITLCK